MDTDIATIYFKHPCTMIVAGPTGSGKTYFVKDVIDNCMIRDKDGRPPERIIWFYGVDQPLYHTMNAEYSPPYVIAFCQGIDASVLETLDPNKVNLVVVDDLMREAVKSDAMERVFTQGSHHLGTTLILMMQNLYHQGKNQVTMNRNTHYTIIFGNKKNQSEGETLARQIYGGGKRRRVLADLLARKTSKKHSYVVIDSHPQSEHIEQFRRKIFPGQKTKLYEIADPRGPSKMGRFI